MRLALLGAVILACALPGAAQTIIEAGALAGAATAGAGPAARIGASLDKVLGKVETTLAGKPSASPASALKGSKTVDPSLPVLKPSPPPPPKPLKTDFDSVAPGLSRTELIAKVGPPSFAIASSGGESLSYICREGERFTVQIEGGKVTTVAAE